MILHQENKSIEFTIESYQFPEEKSSKEEFNYDANWLVCVVHYSDAEINETYRDACLLTDELADMAEMLLKIHDGSEDGYISEFMEPYLQVAAARVDEKILIIFKFDHKTSNGVWKHRQIVTLLSQDDTAEIVQALKDLVNRYPKR